jgi:pyruvate formate lyase activating enzyme
MTLVHLREVEPRVKGIFFNIQRYAIHDGPGIRTTVFLKGCPLSCAWCHNPEGRSGEPEILILRERCMDCGECVAACPNPPPVGHPDSDHTDSHKCVRCGSCADACPAGARRLVGREISVGDLINEAERDRPFYEQTRGGVTFSGGEPLVQDKFLLECLEECRARGLHVAVDTCGFASRDITLQVSKLTHLLLFDLKILDHKAHEVLTGVPLQPILDNLRAADDDGAEIIVRFPLIPGITDSAKNIDALGNFVSSLRNTRRVHVLSFHRTASDKYARLGRPWSFGGVTPAPRDQVDRAVESLRGHGLKADSGGWSNDG